jgi:hypothetical protein
MRSLLGLLATLIVSSASALQVDGIPVDGNVHTVSVADIRDAIKAVHGDVSKIRVLKADRMHVFLKPTDLGWIAVRRDPYAKQRTDRKWPGWLCDGRGVDDPQISQFIRTADELYVFPVLTPDEPHRDNKHSRLLDNQVRRMLVRLLTDHRNWYQGAYNMIIVEPEPRNIGLLFRRDRSELVLFFSHSFTSSAGLIHGNFNGQHIEDMLEDNPGKKMEQWCHRFAQPELVPTNRSNQTMQRTPTRRSAHISHD